MVVAGRHEPMIVSSWEYWSNHCAMMDDNLAIYSDIIHFRNCIIMNPSICWLLLNMFGHLLPTWALNLSHTDYIFLIFVVGSTRFSAQPCPLNGLGCFFAWHAFSSEVSSIRSWRSPDAVAVTLDWLHFDHWHMLILSPSCFWRTWS